jgi:hypothetical protein
MRVPMVKKCQRLTDLHITCAREPPGLPLGQFTNVSPKRFGKNDLRQLRHHRAGSGLAVGGLGDGELQGILQPLPRRVVADVDFDERWQAAEEGLAELRIAGQKAADEPGGRAATAKVQ